MLLSAQPLDATSAETDQRLERPASTLQVPVRSDETDEESATRRVDYTRNERAMRDALVRRLRTSPISRITVNQITSDAHVSRGAFYLHHDSVYQLLDEVESDLMSELMEINKDFPNSQVDFWEHDAYRHFADTYRWIAANREYITVLLSPNGPADFEQKWVNAVEFVLNAKLENEDITDADREILIAAICAAWLAAIKTWNRRDQDLSAEAMARLIGRLTGGIITALRSSP